MSNPARKGPKKVWDRGYRNLRVPIAIFNDVKRYMERRKYEYLTSGDNETGENYDDERFDSMGEGVQTQIPSVLRQIIQDEFAKFQNQQGVYTPGIADDKRSSKEKVLDLLVENPGDKLPTTNIAKVLGMPESTARQAARELAKENPNIKQQSGRPSKYWYQA